MTIEERNLSLARLFVEDKSVIRFNKHFYLFNEGIWRLESDENTEAWITTEYIKKYSRPPKSLWVKEITKYIRDFTYDIYRKKIKYLSENHITNTINVKSGILDLNTLEVTPYTKETFCFYKLPFDYQKDTYAKQMMTFLLSSMNIDLKESNQEQIFACKRVLKFIQEWMGYSLVAGNRLEKCLLMIGEGANGKSVLQDIWEYIIGEYNCAYVDLRYINDGSQIFMTRNKLVNFSKDLESNQQLDTGITKAAVSGQKVICNEKYKGQVEMDFTAKIVIACNELPYIKNASMSVKRRFHILPFARVFAEHEQDRDLINKLKGEADKIFSWAVNGLKNLKERGDFDVPDRCKYSMSNYIKNNDSIELWIEDGNISRKGSSAKTTDAYKDYKVFCEESQSRPFGRNKFYERVETKGYRKKKVNGEHYFADMKLPNQTIL